MMKYYDDCEFERTGCCFEERTGDPDTFSSAIGRITLNFSELEDQVCLAITKLLAVSENIGFIITAESSFRNRMHLLGSLVRHLASTTKFNTGPNDAVEMFSELMALCFKAEELRNQILHSSYTGAYLSDAKATRKKLTAKASKGLVVHDEEIDSGYLLDIADFIITIAMQVEEFFSVVSAKGI